MTPISKPVLFSEDYYRKVIEEYGYSPFDLQRFDFGLAAMDPVELNIRYLCHSIGERFAAAPPERRIVTTGFGMSGPPHMATVAHIMDMVRMQSGGERCQIVLGDLDAYNGRARAFQYTSELAERFRIFVERLGFDCQTGILRTQCDNHEALSNMVLLGRYTRELDFPAAEEDNHEYYAARGIVDATMTFRRRLSLALMASDFITLGQTNDAVLVMLGVDEHKYVRFAQEIAVRLDRDTPIRGNFVLGAVYSRLNSGFNGHPKFSKSLPGSAIGVESGADEIRELVRGDSCREPASSPVFQLMHRMPFFAGEQLIALHRHCAEGSPTWRREKERFADYLVHIMELWP